MKLLHSLAFVSLISHICIAADSATSAKLKAVPEMDFFSDNTPPAGKPTLADVLGINKQCTIISDYTMGLRDVMLRLQDANKQTLVLAPLNTAILALPQKPWLDASGSEEKRVNAQRNEERAEANIARFVSAHLAESIPAKAGEHVKRMTGGDMWFELDKNAVKRVYPGGFKVTSEREAANGQIWTIDGVMTAEQDDRKDDL